MSLIRFALVWSEKTLRAKWLFPGSVCLVLLLGVVVLTQKGPSLPKTDSKVGQSVDEEHIPSAARGVAGLHGWVASDFFDTTEAIRACDAIYWRDQKRLASMIENGLDVNAQKKDGITLLHWAVACNSFECFKILLQAGADPDVPLTKTIKSKDGPVYYGIIFYARDTILHSCSRLLWTRYLDEGLKFCRQPDQRGAGDERIKDTLGPGRGDAETFRLLFAAAAEPNFSDSAGHSGFVNALITGDYDTIRVLMDYHADPLFGDCTAERILEMTDERIEKKSDGQHAFELGVLKEFRQAVITRSEQLKAEKALDAENP